MDGVLTEANSATHKDIDMFVMVLMSHGAKHQIMGTDMKPVDIEEQIISMFHDDKAPGLKGIPKLFLVQACRHDKKTSKAAYMYYDYVMRIKQKHSVFIRDCVYGRM